MKKSKKRAAWLLTLVTAFSSVFPAYADSALVKGLAKKDQMKAEQTSIGFAGLAPDEKVKIIVLLSGGTAVDEAVRRGVSLSELSDSMMDSSAMEARRQQEVVKREISDENIDITYHFSYDTIVNGFSATVKAQDALRIAEMPGVIAVRKSRQYRKPKPIPAMESGKGMIGADILQGEGHTGKGIVVSVIDSGFDPSHPDLTLGDASEVKLRPADVSALGLPGEYKSEKIPYGYDYADEDRDTVEKGFGSHGMHVAGTISANGTDGKGGIRGVAPDAQILAMKVFPDDRPTASDDVIIRAIDDSVKLRADVMNLSLGSDAGMAIEDAFDFERLAVQRAANAGVVMVIAAGNANHYGTATQFLPGVANPDYGVVGTPAAYEESFAVASINNVNINGLDAMTIQEGEKSFKMPFRVGGALPVTTGTPLSVEFAGLGTKEEVADKDFTGKLVIIERGKITFAEKAENAHSKGAVMAMIYNHEAGGNSFIGMAGLEEAKIPVASMLRADALSLKEKKDLVATFTNGETVDIVNPKGGKMSDFTSWGVTADLTLKPEITAPGGDIRSLDNGNGYQQMSGTSMATPHIAGATALFLEAKKDSLLKGKTEMEKVLLTKNIFMSTAVPVEYDKGVYESPRRQGAGILSLTGAVNTPAYLRNGKTKQAKVELGDKVNSGNFDFEIVNFSDEPVTYNITAQATMDSVSEGKVNPNMPQSISSQITLSHPQTVTVGAGSRETITVSYDFSGLSSFETSLPNGFFVEGFVLLKDADEIEPNPTLSIPFVGFKGDWKQARILDYNNYEIFAGEGRPFYDLYTGLYTTVSYNPEEGKYQDLGSTRDGKDYKKENIAFSPDGDENGDKAFFGATFLRNAREMSIEIQDKDGKVIATPYQLDKSEFIPKNFYDGNDQNPLFHAEEDWSWDGKLASGTQAPDGDYKFVVKVKLGVKDAEYQVMEMPIKIDTVDPILVEVDEGDKEVKLTAVDSAAGIREYRLEQEGKETLFSENGIFEGLDIPELKKTRRKYFVIDNAHNIVTLEKEAEQEKKEDSGGAGKPDMDKGDDEIAPPSQKMEDKSADKDKATDSKPSEKRFTDVESSHWAKEAITAVTEKGWFSGYPDGSFRPKNTISRAEAALVLVKVFDLKAADTGVKFSDVPEDAWYAESVKTLSSLGVMSGFPDNSFRPQAKVDREQMMVLLVKAMEKSGKTLEGKELSFTDADSISVWAKSYVEKAQANALVSGFEDGSFRPKSPVSRAELAMMLYRQMENGK
ncbi:MAG: S8 family serine peptidase [Peptostreptococcaceae bacterium]|nr:S8 family serine peptidase [Peptostreptococcaceae bacterium]